MPQKSLTVEETLQPAVPVGIIGCHPPLVSEVENF